MRYYFLLLFFSIILGVFIFYLVGREQIPDAVREALQQAGANKKELLTLIRHYKTKGQEEHLKAAYFLIRNMSGKSSYIYDVKSLSLNALKKQKRSSFNYVQRPDLEYITADYLIENIDLAHCIWKKYSWCRGLSFTDFCEKILPYRLLSEPLTDWRRYYYEKHKKELDSLEASGATQREVCFYINKNYQKKYIKSADLLPVSLPYHQLEALGGGTCGHLAYSAVLEMRACGIPLHFDVVVRHGRINGGHIYNSLDSSRFHPEFIFFSPYERAPERKKWRAHQVLRIHFKNKDADILEKGNLSSIPDEIVQNSAYTDVTSLYYPQQSIAITLKNAAKQSIVYLCTYNRGRFYAVRWSELHKGRAYFPGLTKELLYFPMFYINNQYVPAYDPFIVRDAGVMELLQVTQGRQTISNVKLYAVRTDITKRHTPYTLYYWDKKWVYFGEALADERYTLSFKEVPTGTLYLLRGAGFEARIQRPFSYNNGNIEYW